MELCPFTNDAAIGAAVLVESQQKEASTAGLSQVTQSRIELAFDLRRIRHTAGTAIDFELQMMEGLLPREHPGIHITTTAVRPDAQNVDVVIRKLSLIRARIDFFEQLLGGWLQPRRQVVGRSRGGAAHRVDQTRAAAQCAHADHRQDKQREGARGRPTRRSEETR
jgi:hypothetical protein